MGALLYSLIAIPITGKIGFAIVMSLLILSYPGTFTVVPVFAKKRFGCKYFTSNYGIFTLAYVFLNCSF